MSGTPKGSARRSPARGGRFDDPDHDGDGSGFVDVHADPIGKAPLRGDADDKSGGDGLEDPVDNGVTETFDDTDGLVGRQTWVPEVELLTEPIRSQACCAPAHIERPGGFGVYGGAGAYSGAVVSVAGFDFGRAPLKVERPTDIQQELSAIVEGQRTEPSGSDLYDELTLTETLQRCALGRPGVQTMWDALVGEGRRFFNSSNSGWRGRGPLELGSTLDP